MALIGQTNAVYSLTNKSYDEDAAEAKYIQTHNQTLLCYQYTLRAQLSYIFCRYEDALRISGKSDAVIASAPGQIIVADHFLYRGLAATAVLISGAPNRRRLRLIARKCLHQLYRFATNSPENFLQYAKLLEADCARAAGNAHGAFKLYNQAIDLAEKQKFHHLVGLANERAALCLLAEGQRRAAAGYLAWAREAYVRWGAAAKVEMIDREFAPLLGLAAAPLKSAPSSTPTPIEPPSGTDSFDVVGATAALQLAASEKGRDRVLFSLMESARAQSGAETAYLISPITGAYRVEAAAIADGVWRSPEQRAQAFSSAIINYVVHAGSDVIVDNPHLDARFSQCEYLARCQPKAVMCSAIVKQSELLGVMYLEHGRLVQAFDRNKLQWLRIFGSEVGLTLWADRLNRYREYIHRFTPVPAAQEIDANPDNPDLAVREKDVSILFADLAGYTKMHELMGHNEADHLVNRAFSEFVEEIHLCHGVVIGIRGDELLVLFQDNQHGGHAFNAATAGMSIARAATRLTRDRSADQPPITVNMAINSGPAAIGLQPIEFGTGARWRYDATGTTVNIAARIRELSRDGQILVSAATLELLDSKFDYQDMGQHSLKNLSIPVHVFRLLDKAFEKP